MCDRATGAGGVDGAWWPATHDLSNELPDLIAVVGSLIGPIRRVVYDSRVWPPAPARVIRGGTSITVDSYRLVASDTIYLMGTHTRDAVLFVVPSDTDAETAQRMLKEVSGSSHPMTINLMRALLHVPEPGSGEDELWGGPASPISGDLPAGPHRQIGKES
ncbi:DUF5994 family protein [Mycolicibacterium mengxianglii]|uniref:DUF5994 family protein n=1 Tax=Mycolicibacterium mengxianglii TaxID=2736649 RepID=UPI001E3A040F|nr:DUF5994 family protein [Mycolicibacterium mengxianglii]